MPRKIRKPRRPKWVPLTDDNKFEGATIRTHKRVMYQFVGTITNINRTEYGHECVKVRITSRINNYNWDDDSNITLYYKNYRDEYIRYKAKIFIDINNFIQEYHCKCASCGARKAKFRKGLCPECNSKAI